MEGVDGNGNVQLEDELDEFIILADNNVDNDDEVAEFEVISETTEDCESDELLEEQENSKFMGIRPTWQPDSSTVNCTRCEIPFSLFNRSKLTKNIKISVGEQK